MVLDKIKIYIGGVILYKLLFIILKVYIMIYYNNINVLVIISSHEFNVKDINNIKILNNYLINTPNITVDYCGITHNIEYFNIFNNIINFKYKIINNKPQLSKMCDFISDYKNEFNYNYFIKFRPDLTLLEPINFNNIDVNSICARAREYKGPQKIKYGLQGDPINYLYLGETYSDIEQLITIDDQLYIFTNNIVNMGAFNKLTNEENKERENEWFHTKIFNERKIPLKIIGINVFFTKHNTYSANLNY
jgi:hypothetical protein